MSDYYNLELPDIDSVIKLHNDFTNYQLIKPLSRNYIELLCKEALSFFSVIRPEHIKFEYVSIYIMNYKDLAPVTINLKKTFLRIILKYLLDKGFKNCNFKIYSNKVSSKLPKYFSEDDMSNLLKKYQRAIHTNRSLWKGRRDYALLIFMYATGLRASEIIKFKITDLENNWIRVDNGKGQKDRFVPIAPKAVRALEDYLKYLPMHIKNSSPYVFKTDLLVPFTRLTLNNFTKKKYGFNPHFFRHIFATHLISNGCNEYVLMDFLGHSDLSTTQIYTNIQKNHLKKTVEKYFPNFEL